MNKFILGQVLKVKNIDAKVTDIKTCDGEPDYFLKPISPGHDLCGCGELECGGGTWFLESELKIYIPKIKYTQEPWNGKRIHADGTIEILNFEHKPICTMSTRDMDGVVENGEENALLIMAAPNMLTLLHHLLRHSACESERIMIRDFLINKKLGF